MIKIEIMPTGLYHVFSVLWRCDLKIVIIYKVPKLLETPGPCNHTLHTMLLAYIITGHYDNYSTVPYSVRIWCIHEL